MKVEQRNLANLTQLDSNVRKKALHGHFYDLRRVIVLEADGKYNAISFTLLERIAAAFYKIIGKDYFKKCLGAKKCQVIDCQKLKDLKMYVPPAPVPAQEPAGQKGQQPQPQPQVQQPPQQPLPPPPQQQHQLPPQVLQAPQPPHVPQAPQPPQVVQAPQPAPQLPPPPVVQAPQPSPQLPAPVIQAAQPPQQPPQPPQPPAPQGPTLPPYSEPTIQLTPTEEKMEGEMLNKIRSKASDFRCVLNDTSKKVLAKLLLEDKLYGWSVSSQGVKFYYDAAGAAGVSIRDKAYIQAMARSEQIVAYMEAKYSLNKVEMALLKTILVEQLPQQKTGVAFSINAGSNGNAASKVLDLLLEESHLNPQEKLVIWWSPSRASNYIMKTQLTDQIPASVESGTARTWDIVKREQDFRNINRIDKQDVLDQARAQGGIDEKELGRIIDRLNERREHGPLKLLDEAKLNAPLQFLLDKHFICQTTNKQEGQIVLRYIYRVPADII